WAGVLYGLVITVASGLLMLALSSLSRRSVYVGLAWAGFVFLSHMLSSALIGIRGDIERRQIVQEGINRWVQDHPPPPGVEMRGPYPSVRYPPPRPGKPDPSLTEEEKAKEQWFRDWSAAFGELNDRAEAARLAQGYADWRPVLSYANNLDRLGDWLLDTNSAWELIGRTIQQPRQMVGPGGRGRNVPVSSGAPNDRLMAERMAWQFPWYWSAAALAGVCLLSAFVLSRRVKSLDRLK